MEICQIHPGGSAAPQVDPVVIATLQHLPGIRGAFMEKKQGFHAILIWFNRKNNGIMMVFNMVLIGRIMG